MIGGRSPGFVGAIALLNAAVLTGGITAAAVHRPTATPRWDPRVAPVARFVERHRHLRFRAPVPVRFLETGAFQSTLLAGTTSGRRQDEHLRHALGQLRALGLVRGDPDLRALQRRLTAADVIGLYIPERRRVYVRGAQLTPGVRVTLAHELTHALDDQHFSLARLRRLGQRRASVTALIEGDAVWVQNQYVISLNDAEAKAYREEVDRFQRQADVGGIPKILQDIFTFPYAFGPAFVETLVATGGSGAINRALRRPPEFEAQILDPSRYVTRVQFTAVGPPRLGPADKRVDSPAEFGEFSLFEMLGTWLGYDRAWTAVRRWQGDTAVTFTRAGRDCIAIATRWAAAADTSTFDAAVRDWSARAAPTATITRAGRTVEVRACDPGPAGPAPPTIEPAPSDVLALRAQIIAGAVHNSGLTVRQAACAADGVIARFGGSALIAVGRAGPNDPLLHDIQQEAARAVKACGR